MGCPQIASKISCFLQTQHPSPSQEPLTTVLKEPNWVDFFPLKIPILPNSHVVTFWPADKWEIWYWDLISHMGQTTCPRKMFYSFQRRQEKVRWYIWPLSWTGPQSRKKPEIQRTRKGALFTEYYWIYLATNRIFQRALFQCSYPKSTLNPILGVLQTLIADGYFRSLVSTLLLCCLTKSFV